MPLLVLRRSRLTPSKTGQVLYTAPSLVRPWLGRANEPTARSLSLTLRTCARSVDNLRRFSEYLFAETPRRALEAVADMRITCAKIELRSSEYIGPRYQGIQGKKIGMIAHEEEEHSLQTEDCQPLHQGHCGEEPPENVRSIPDSGIYVQDARQRTNRTATGGNEVLEE